MVIVTLIVASASASFSYPISATELSKEMNESFIKNDSIPIDPKIRNSKTWIDDEAISKKMNDLEFVTKVDRFKKYRAIFPKHFEELGGIGGFLDFDEVYLNIVKYEGDDGANFFYGRIVYEGLGWSFLTAKVYLILNGTERIRLNGIGSGKESEVSSAILL